MKKIFIIMALLLALTSCSDEVKDCPVGQYEYGQFNGFYYYESDCIGKFQYRKRALWECRSLFDDNKDVNACVDRFMKK